MSPSGRSETPGDSRPEDDGHILAGEIKVQRRGDLESTSHPESVVRTQSHEKIFLAFGFLSQYQLRRQRQ